MRCIDVDQLCQISQLPSQGSGAPFEAARALPEAVQAENAQPSGLPCRMLLLTCCFHVASIRTMTALLISRAAMWAHTQLTMAGIFSGLSAIWLLSHCAVLVKR